MTKQIGVIESKSNIHYCNRCKHKWVGKLENPKTCANPKCRTPYWNRPRIRKQNKAKTPNDKFYFYFEREDTSKSYSFAILDKEIICEECNNKICNHVFEIISDPKVREKIAKKGIEFLPEYEKGIKTIEKNVKALKEYVENQ